MTSAICLCLVLLQLTYVNARLLTKSDLTFMRNNLPGHSQSTHNSELLIQGRQRPLFARRVYERQKVYELRHRMHLRHPKGPPPKVTQIPDSKKCFEVSESCVPHSGCCDPCASCHCRFFNTICFCRKINAFCGKEA